MENPSQKPENRPIFLSLGTRLTVPVVLLVAAVAGGAYFGITRAQRTTAMRSKEVAADMVAQLTSLSVMPAVVFGDEVEIKRALGDLAKNPEITDVVLWAVDAEDDRRITQELGSFHRMPGRALVRPSQSKRERKLEADGVRALEPIVGPDGKTVGVLALRFSTAREAQALAALTQQIFSVSIATALCLAAAILFVLRRLVVLPMRRLRQAALRLARGGGEQEGERLVHGGKLQDEVVQLAQSFREMAQAVRDREARLAVRNAELRLVFDSVDQGFLTAEPDGSLLPERSTIVARWIGDLPDELKFWELAARIDPSVRDWVELAWSQMQDGFLPLELSLEQLPKRLTKDDKHFDLAYHTVLDGERIERVVIVMTDVTAEVERERALAEQHEFSVLVDQFVRDRRAFLDFWREASELVKRVLAHHDGNGESLKRDVHTLKGNARFFGLTRLSALCHSFEDAMLERGEHALSNQERAQLGDAWESLRRRIEPLMHGATSFVQISEEEYVRLAEAVQRKERHESLAEIVHGLRHEPTEWRLNRARETLQSACLKLGKAAPAVTVEHHDLRLAPGAWAPFWSVFPHLVNNAADHGIESDEERQLAGKKLPSKVLLSTLIDGRELVVEITDDGRGIDWERVRKLASQRGLTTQSQRDLEEALLSDGFSLKHTVSEVSGRGLGLSAVRSVVTAMGGRLEVQSTLGQGTSWRFRFPMGRLEAAGASQNQVSSVRARTA